MINFKIKLLFAFSIILEVIKILPIYNKFNENSFNVKIYFAIQHREMLDNIISLFKVKAGYNLDLMKSNTRRIIMELE